MKNTVIYTPCENYTTENIENAVNYIFDNLENIEEKIKKAKKILIKPNLLAPRPPEAAITTHPELIIAIINRINKYGAEITIADTPAGKMNETVMKKLYKTCGMSDVAEKTGVNLNWNFDSVDVQTPNAKTAKSYPLLKIADDADLIINVAKMKTHCFTMLTCATKNYFGLIPGLLKMQYHFTIPRIEMFANMLLDVEQYLDDKTINIVDGIVGMEGNGPSNGTPKEAQCILAGYNSVATDILACHVMGIDPKKITTISEAKKRGIIKDFDLPEITSQTEVKTYSFQTPPDRGRTLPSFIPEWFASGINNLLISKPVIEPEKCVGCQICAKGCPPQIITMKDNIAEINDYSKCIRCFCCQEVCPQNAINVAEPAGRKLIKKLKIR